jgi:hypothetical protein
MNKKWYDENIKTRKQWLKAAEHDVVFAANQIVFWKNYLADAKKHVKTYQRYVTELEEKQKGDQG